MNIHDEIKKTVENFNDEYSGYKVGDTVVNNHVCYGDDNKFRAGIIVKLSPSSHDDGQIAIISNKNGNHMIHTDHLKIVRHSTLEQKELTSGNDEWTQALIDNEFSTRLIRKPSTEYDFSPIFNNNVHHENVVHHETIRYVERPRTSILQKIQNFIDYIRWGRYV